MLNEKQERYTIYGLLALTVMIFFGFGMFHLAEFETTDEHLWKYGRIPQYWHALKDKDWSGTYINDKPGVTVALISGIGLLSEHYSNPTKNTVLDTTNPHRDIYEIYKPEEVLRINYTFRLPVLIFSTLSLFIFFWLSKKVFGSSWLALITTIAIALNPIIVGMSQIINPDSFFWIFGGLSAFSYLALLRTNEKKFIFLTIFFTGFALLSKYTAITLFIFYVLALFGHIIFAKETNETVKENKFIIKHIIILAITFIASIGIFVLFIPAIFVEPKLLVKGISQFISLKEMFLLSMLIIGAMTIMLIKKNIYPTIVSFLQKYNYIFVFITSILFLFVLIFSLINVHTQQKMIPFDELKNNAYANEPKDFNFKPLYAEDTKLWKKTKLYFMETYPIIFSLTPITLLLIFYISFKSLFKKTKRENLCIYFSVTTFFLIYFFLTIFARVVTNVRYSIVLYPLIAILITITLRELSHYLPVKKQKFFAITSIVFLVIGTITLWSLRPFYFSYASSLLPKQFSIHDSWGHGSYEAAQHLNSLPNA
ncbi:MAG: glycosyltransferase family 39 protein, partial [Patescibacteria group bacterium]